MKNAEQVATKWFTYHNLLFFQHESVVK